MTPKEQALLDAVKRFREAKAALTVARAGIEAAEKTKHEADDAYDQALTAERDAENRVKALIERLLSEDTP